MYRKAWCTCKVVVLLNKPIAFLPFSSPSSAKAPYSWAAPPRETSPAAKSVEKRMFSQATDAHPHRKRFATRGLFFFFSGLESCFVFSVFALKIKVSIILKMMKWNYQLTKQHWLVCATIQKVWILNFAFGPEKFPGLSRNGPKIRLKRSKHVYRSWMYQRPRFLTRDLILCQLNQIVDTSPVNRKKSNNGRLGYLDRNATLINYSRRW